MDTDSHKALARRLIDELWNARRLASAEELVARDCISYPLQSGEGSRGEPRGPAAVQNHILEWLAAFPDLRFHIEQMVAEGPVVTTLARLVGTHTGPWLGLPPTGRFLAIRLVTTQRFVAGKLAEEWVLCDLLGVLQQLEVLPATADLLIRGAQMLRQREQLARQARLANRRATPADPRALATLEGSALYRALLASNTGVEVWDCEEPHDDGACYFWIVTRQDETVRVLAYVRWQEGRFQRRAFDQADHAYWVEAE
jgi:predicted ester cyclase